METLVENVNGLYMPVNGTKKLMPDWEEHVKKIASHVKNKTTCVEAGGFIGHFTSVYANLFDTVYSFEPDPLNFFCLNKNVQSTNVIKLQSCLGDSHGLVGITLPDAHKNSPIKRTGMYHVTNHGVIPTLMIDDLELDSCDLIQLDIEGYEIHAIKGAKNTIEKFKPVICLEINKSLKNFKYKKQDVYNLLDSLNYKVVDNINEDVIFKHSTLL